MNESGSFVMQWGGYIGIGNCIETYATDNNDGAENTGVIYSALTIDNPIPIAANTYPAGTCYEYSVNANNDSPCTSSLGETCYSNWYLPATHELNTLREQTGFNGGPLLGSVPFTIAHSDEVDH